MIKFVDMFSGIGGFREGLTRAGGFECVGHCEIDKYANRSYNALFDTKGEWFMHLLRAGVNMIYIRDFLGHADISTTEVYARIDAEMKRKVFEEKVPNYTPNTTMPWEEDEDLLQWLTQFGKKTF